MNRSLKKYIICILELEDAFLNLSWVNQVIIKVHNCYLLFNNIIVLFLFIPPSFSLFLKPMYREREKETGR